MLPVLSLRDEQDRPRNDFDSDVRNYGNFGEKNRETLGELLFQFFRRYGHEIDFEIFVMSVRMGQPLTKREKGWALANNNRLCVEEPFNTDRNLGNTADDTAFRGIHLELRQAFGRIASSQDLLTSVCEQFEFPTEEHRPLFERPQPGPRPVLSRSASQSGRGNRTGGGRRANRQQFDQRNGINARRSSSAATFGGNPPQVYLPAQSYYLQQEELSRLSRAMSAEEQHLRLRQAQIIEAQLAQMPRGATSPVPPQQRPPYNGYTSSPRLANAELAANHVTTSQTYPFPASYESAVAMSHSSSQQGTNTNPNSPLLAPATPNRRGFQRQAAMNSPGAAIRSQSQPARPIQLPLMQQQPARPQYGQTIYPTMQGTAAWPAHLPRPAYYGPYVNAMGVHYLAVPHIESVPREYLGYGIGGVPQFGQFGQASAYSQAPTFGDFGNQDGQTSPTRQSSSASLSTGEMHRSPSPLPRNHSQANGLHSAPVTATFSRHPQSQTSTPRQSDDSVPVIVNGSYAAAAPRAQTLDNGESLDSHRMSNATRFARVPSDLALGAFSHRHNASQASSHRSESGLPVVRDVQTPRAEDPSPYPHVQASIATDASPAVARTPSDMPPPPRPSQVASHNRAPPDQTSPESLSDRRRSSGSNKHMIPHLDLANPVTERLRDSAPTTAKALSPVEETRTPSPSQNRKHTARKSAQINGLALPTPPTPLPTRGELEEDQKSHVNGSANPKNVIAGGLGSHARSSSTTNVSASTSQQANQWQQAGVGKKKNNSNRKANQPQSPGAEKKSGGEPMPVSEAARKGG